MFSVADTYYGDCTCWGALIMDPVCIKCTLDIITNWQRIPDEAHVLRHTRKKMTLAHCVDADAGALCHVKIVLFSCYIVALKPSYMSHYAHICHHVFLGNLTILFVAWVSCITWDALSCMDDVVAIQSDCCDTVIILTQEMGHHRLQYDHLEL